MLHGTAVATLLRWNWERRTADPKTIPGSPIADQSTDSNEVFLAAAVRLRVVSEEMSGAEVVHTFVATMWPDGVATTAPMPPRAIASWSDAILFGRVAGCRGADLPRLIEEPAEPRTQKRQGPPEGRAMNIRPRAGETRWWCLANPPSPNSGPFRNP
jgi:hypothetical protein